MKRISCFLCVLLLVFAVGCRPAAPGPKPGAKPKSAPSVKQSQKPAPKPQTPPQQPATPRQQPDSFAKSANDVINYGTGATQLKALKHSKNKIKDIQNQQNARHQQALDN